MSAEAIDPVGELRKLGAPGFLVGGAVRDRLLGKATGDYDVAVGGEPREIARALARRIGGHPFALSEGFGAWRVVTKGNAGHVDVLPLHEGGIEADLAQRDLTINAIAQPLDGGQLLDPFGGRDDLVQRRLRMVSPGAFVSDPLRVMRLVRLACELGFETDAETRVAAGAAAGALAEVAAERVFEELKRIVCAQRAIEGLDLLDEVGATDVVLPELSALRGVCQSHYHHLDVHGHTREVLAATIELERNPDAWLGEHGAELSRLLAVPLADELSRWQALRFGAVFHDIAKPETRAVTPDGRVTFFGHDVLGAETATRVLGRLRASQKLGEHVAALTRRHLRLGFLVARMPLSPREVYGYLRACEPVEVDVTVLGVADRLATRGKGAEQAIERHLRLAKEMLADALRWHRERPRSPLRGDELMRELGMAPGPQLGEVLQLLEEAAYAGEISTREQALQRARELVADRVIVDR